MSFTSWLQDLRSALAPDRGARASRPRRRSVRLALEQLEDRTVPASFTASTVSDLIADINAANLAGGSNTITLAAGKTFTLTAGELGVTANNDLIILGNGDTIERSTAAATPAFRLFDVSAGASLTLDNLTLQGGIAYGSGGGIYSRGTLTLNTVTVQNNVAYSTDPFYGYQSAYADPALGGGIYSSGTLTVTGGKLQNNQAIGRTFSYEWYYSDIHDGVGYEEYGYETFSSDARGGGLYVAGGTAALSSMTITGNIAQGAVGGYSEYRLTYYDTDLNVGSNEYSSGATSGASGYGGGLYAAGGTVTLTGITLSANSALGGAGYNGGNGYGGGLFAAGGTVTVLHSTVTSNAATGGSGGRGHPNGKAGAGAGGGLYIDAAALAYFDAYTVTHTTKNLASHFKDIFGSWTLS